MSLPRHQHDRPSTPRPGTPPVGTPCRTGGRRATGLLAALLSALAALVLLPAGPAPATPWPGHPDRSIVRHVVQPGDTATGLAVRYHAWTDELVRLNRLGAGATLRPGQVLRIPVVLSAARRDGDQQEPRAQAPVQPVQPVQHDVTPPGRGWLHADLSRAQVRRLIIGTARRHGVPPRLALAVAWQESGWQQRRVSSTGALGVMQVMPDTGRWMELYVGRRLRLRDTHDNVLAGVMTIRVLRSETRQDNRAIAAYYQGLRAVRRHGFYDDTRQYLAAVRAHERRIARTGSPV